MANGEVQTPLDEAGVRAMAKQIKEEGEIEALSVNFLFSYVTPDHEQRVKEILAEELPHIPVSISYDVMPKWKEYERASTTLADAYVKPIVSKQMHNIRKRFTDHGITDHIVVIKSNGGEMTLEAAENTPIQMTVSGPTGGVIAGKHIAGLVGIGAATGQAGEADSKQGTAAKSSSSKDASKNGGKKAAASKTEATTAALVERGKAYIEQRQAGKAIESLSQAIGLDAENSEAFYQRARAHALARLDANALADYSAAIRLDPKRARLYYSRGYFFLSRRLADKAIADLEKSIELDPKEIEPIQFLGLAHVAKKEYQQAIAAFDQALKIKPDSSDVYNNRGFTYLQAKKFDNALKDFKKAIQINPESVNSYNNMGLTYFAMEDYRSSASSFTKAIEKSPNTPNFYLQRQAAYLKLGMQNQADADGDKLNWLKQLAVLNIALARQPRNSAKYVERAHHLLDGGEESAALEDFNRAVKADPQYAQALSARAAYWFSKGKLDRVIDDCGNAISIQPHQEAYSIRGDVWMKKGDFEKAIADFVKAKRFDATVAQAYLMRAKALKSQGNDEQARKSFERAVALDPSIEKSLQ